MCLLLVGPAMSFLSRPSSARALRRVQVRHYATGTQQTESLLGSSIRTALYTTGFVIGTTAFAIYYADSRSAIHRYVIPPLSRTLLDAEMAHKIALRALRSGLGPRDQCEDDNRLRVEVRSLAQSQE
jgi:dihydroorotate dehydrogenase